jgi:hypothetical protein
VVQELGILLDGPGEMDNGMQNGNGDYGDYGGGMNGATYSY